MVSGVDCWFAGDTILMMVMTYSHIKSGCIS